MPGTSGIKSMLFKVLLTANIFHSKDKEIA